MYGRIIEKLRKLSKYDAGLYLRFLHRIFKQRRLYKKFPDDREFLEKKYLAETGRQLNLDNPERFTEKIQWMKVFYRNPLMTRCADKLAVREYVRSKGCGNLLNELIAVYDSAEAFDPAELPDRFVVKATHGSSMNLICKDKNTVNWKLKKRIFKLWMKVDISLDGREWVYKEVPHRIIVEKYLEDDSGSLRDYKLFCFGGRVEFIQVDEDRYSAHKQSYYSADWERLDFTTGNEPCNVEKPSNLEEMKDTAAKLSEDFPFVRVDLYNCNGETYFGELTFFGGSGFYSFNPDNYDFKYGGMFKLPEANMKR